MSAPFDAAGADHLIASSSGMLAGRRANLAAAPAGSEGADTLRGSAVADILNGLGGDDVLFGDAGNDSLDGGGGADTLDGEDGDDTLLGGAGNDSLYDSRGNNVLRGGDGDDRLEAASNGSNALYGDAGKDILTSSRGSGLLDGGAGDDGFFISGYWSADGPQTIDARGGEGNDSFETALGTGAALTVLLSGGSGSDTFIAQTRAPAGAGTVSVSDFTAGAGGDLVDISRVALATSGNPFAAGTWSSPGSVRLVQRGADTVVQARAVFSDSAPWDDVLVLRNLAASALTAHNFSFGFNPDGSSTGLLASGSAGADHVDGGWLDDNLDGGAGNDTLFGSMGNDRLAGGDGADLLDGDRVGVRPGSYTPWTAERSGDDVLDGGAGNDTLLSAWGKDTLLGGLGDDLLRVSAPSHLAQGQAAGYTVTMDGGEGQDRIEVRGAGMAAPDLLISGGAGSDTFSFDAPPQSGSWTILDFQAGAGGDVLDIFEALGWTRQSPFASGYFRLEQRGLDTVVQYDADGTNAASSFADLVTLKNLAAGALTAANMRYGHTPDGAVPALAAPVTGSTDADRLQGGQLADQLDGRAGNDVLLGGAGNDLLHGGAGIDTALFGGARAQYTLEPLYDLNLYVSDGRGGAGDGKDWLIDVERLVFADGALALDTGPESVAGRAYRIYRAAFDRTPDEGGLGYWIAAMDGGMAFGDVAAHFVGSQEFTSLYGAAPTSSEIVTRMYRNILDRDPEQAGFDFWVSVLDRKLVDLPSLLAEFSESNENRTAVAEIIAEGMLYQPFGG